MGVLLWAFRFGFGRLCGAPFSYSVITDYVYIISVIAELSRGFIKIILLFLIYFLCLFSLEFLHAPNTAYRPRWAHLVPVGDYRGRSGRG